MKHKGSRSYMNRAELEASARRWPCYDGPRVGGWAEFWNGDLVDLSPGWLQRDGAVLAAIVDDMKEARAALAKVQP